MRVHKRVAVVWMAALVAGCGVPREAAQVAAACAAEIQAVPADDAALRAALVRQADAWTRLAALLEVREFGGIQGVDPQFKALVAQTAALARRQRELIAQNQDDPQHNRAALEKLRGLWESARQYLQP